MMPFAQYCPTYALRSHFSPVREALACWGFSYPKIITQTPRASLSRAFARVCQPLPSALRRSMMSGSSIIVTRFLRSSLGSGGRPMRVKCLRSSMVISRTSQCSSIIGFVDESLIDFPFSAVGLAQRDDAQSMSSNGEDHTDKTVINKPKRDLAYFSVITSLVRRNHRGFPVNAMQLGKIKAALLKCCAALGFVPFELHGKYICILSSLGNSAVQQAHGASALKPRYLKEHREAAELKEIPDA
jgi:hypothetical protein